MRVLLSTIGSAGDVRPFIWLARRLESLGHDTTLMVAAYFAPLVESYGVRVRSIPIDMDPRQITERPECMARFRGTGVVLKGMIFPHFPAITRDTIDEIERTSPDLVLSHQIMLGAMWGAEKTGTAWGSVAMAPTGWPSLADPNRYPTMPDRDVYRPWLVRAGLGSAHRVAGWMFDPMLNRQRAAFGLAKQRWIITQAALEGAVNLGLWSSAFRTAAPDDHAHSHVIGFPYLDDPGIAWTRTDDRIKRFLDAGEAPVLITMGSSASMLPGNAHQHLVDACARAGKRVIVLAPESNTPRASDDVLAVAPDAISTPHAGIMPRCACAVVHGGIGTTSEALRAGCPLVIVPHAHDQFDNARRVRLHGAGVILPRAHARGEPATRAITGAIEACGAGARSMSDAISRADHDATDRLARALESVATRRKSFDHATSGDPSRAAAGCATE